MPEHGSRLAVYAAITANGALAVTKFTVAMLASSSAMLSESIHSLVDTGNQALLLVGLERAERPADTLHPFGYGKELYFWSLIVAIVLFGAGGGMSFYEGIRHLVQPVPIGDPTWSYVALGVAALFEGGSWIVGLRQLLRAEGETNPWRAMWQSRDPAVMTVVAEDTAALTGLAIAFAGVFCARRFEAPIADALASMGIGLTLATVSLFLIYQSRGLLIGEGASAEVVESIQSLAESDEAVARARRPLTMQLGPGVLLVNLDLRFREELSAAAVAEAVDRIEGRIRAAHPDVAYIFLEARGLSGREESRPARRPASSSA